MTPSLWLMALSSVFWCQALQLKHLWVYACSVLLTAIGKTIWERFF